MTDPAMLGIRCPNPEEEWVSATASAEPTLHRKVQDVTSLSELAGN